MDSITVKYGMLYKPLLPPRLKGERMANNGMDLIISLNRLTNAIVNSYKEHNMTEEDAQNMAYHVLNFFGFGDRIVDNILEPEDRDIFYMKGVEDPLLASQEERNCQHGMR